MFNQPTGESYLEHLVPLKADCKLQVTQKDGYKNKETKIVSWFTQGVSLYLTVPYCLKSLEHLSQAGRLSFSDEFLRVWGANRQQLNQPQQSTHRLGPSISHSLQKHLLDRMEFQATIGASNKGILFATLLGGEREGGTEKEKKWSNNHNNHKLSHRSR